MDPAEGVLNVGWLKLELSKIFGAIESDSWFTTPKPGDADYEEARDEDRYDVLRMADAGVFNGLIEYLRVWDGGVFADVTFRELLDICDEGKPGTLIRVKFRCLTKAIKIRIG